MHLGTMASYVHASGTFIRRFGQWDWPRYILDDAVAAASDQEDEEDGMR